MNKTQANTEQLNSWAITYARAFTRHETTQPFRTYFKEKSVDLYINGVQEIQGAKLAHEVVLHFAPDFLADALKQINGI
jgi:hypothetical protein